MILVVRIPDVRASGANKNCWCDPAEQNCWCGSGGRWAEVGLVLLLFVVWRSECGGSVVGYAFVVEMQIPVIVS